MEVGMDSLTWDLIVSKKHACNWGWSSHPTFNDGILISWGPIKPYGLGLMSLSPIILERMGVDRPWPHVNLSMSIGPYYHGCSVFNFCRHPCSPVTINSLCDQIVPDDINERMEKWHSTNDSSVKVMKTGRVSHKQVPWHRHTGWWSCWAIRSSKGLTLLFHKQVTKYTFAVLPFTGGCSRIINYQLYNH